MPFLRYREKQRQTSLGRYTFHEVLATDLIEDYRKTKKISSSPIKEKGGGKRKSFLPIEELMKTEGTKGKS